MEDAAIIFGSFAANETSHKDWLYKDDPEVEEFMPFDSIRKVTPSENDKSGGTVSTTSQTLTTSSELQWELNMFKSIKVSFRY